MANKSVSGQAIDWVRANKTAIIAHFAGDDVCASTEEPVSIFMAGSPGAGKTESSLAIVEMLRRRGDAIVRIDPDEIRMLIPQYTGSNTDAIKGASFLAVEKLYDFVLRADKSMILDSTFTPYRKIEANVRRPLTKNRPTAVISIDQDPLVAWHFTKEREKIEGRSIPREFFIRTLFESRENVRKIKEHYGDQITVHVIRKDYVKQTQRFIEDVERIDTVVQIKYSIDDLRELL
ncbi:zeta toxin family protein [Candidatus Peregrinibacteria bacterium]|nr:zeta toxin family protein [Candidatus Peregrinibacteria bacterium]